MSVAGIIFSNLHDKNVSDLTHRRTMASVPFACRYRLIDFALSNMVNSDITNISIITHYNYHSLVDHIGSGKDWDLARRSGGLKILPPYITAYANNANNLYNSRLEALKSVNYSISNIEEDYVVLCDCDIICNVDLSKMIEAHISSGADITLAINRATLTKANSSRYVVPHFDETNRITDLEVYPRDKEGECDVCSNISVLSTRYLKSIMLDAIAHNYQSFNNDVIRRNMQSMNYRVYRFDTFFGKIDSLEDYFACNLNLAKDSALRDELFNIKNRPIYTKVRNSAPTRYLGDSKAKDSLIADGCTIEGTVENSILFRGVHIGKGAIVKNSILYQDTLVGDGSSLNCVIADKSVVIRDSTTLSGHPSLPYYIDKSLML